MRIGVCGMTERIEPAARAGFDYIEPGFWKVASLDESDFSDFANKLKVNNIGADCMNCFLPGNIKLIGDGKMTHEAEEILKTGFERASVLGTKKVIFGSGGARNIPDGVSYKQGVWDIYDFVKKIAAPMAQKYDIMLIFEPLCHLETNLLNTVKEGSMLASFIDEENVFCLADIYHCYIEGDTAEDIIQLKGMIKHSHISNPIPKKAADKRDYPLDEGEFDYLPFVDACIKAGCDTISVEAHTDDFEKDVVPAYKTVKAVVDKAENSNS